MTAATVLLLASIVCWCCYVVASVHARLRRSATAPTWEALLGIGGFTGTVVVALAALVVVLLP